MRTSIALAAVATVVAALAVAPPAAARPIVAVTHVELPERPDAARLGRELRHVLADAIRKANFGPGSAKKRIEVTARLTDFGVDQRGDVIQVHCTLTGRIRGGHGARSRMSFGGAPVDRARLEHDVLRMVANGLVARLADIARADAALRASDESPFSQR